jgi:Tol biopolymer transport system component/DNA-binding winged helix-turn-helix (wHTH) protein
MTVMSGNATRMIQFGVFEVDLRAGELRRNGAKIRLQEQPFRILTMLLERPGEVISREELRTHLWPANTFVDFDHSLNAAVRRLRDALGDTAENPRFVETVARRGYRFLAPVNGAAPAAVSEIAGPHPKSTHKGWIATAAAILLLIGLGVGLFLGRRTSLPLVSSTPLAPRRLTANPSEDPVSSAAISPDGKYLAFSDDTGSYLRQIDTGETHPLTLPPGFRAMPVGWLPDGSHILVTSIAGSAQQAGLWQVSTIGGSPRKLSEEGRAAAVSPDGSQIVFLKGAAKSQELWLMRADGEQSRKVAGEVGDLFRSPVWSADSKQIAFLRGVYRHGEYGVEPQIEILDVTSGERKVVMSQVRFGPALAWTADRLVYVLDESPPNQNDSNVWSVKIDPRTGKPLGTATRLTSGPGKVQYLSSAADGKRLAYVKQSWQPDVYVARVEAKGSKLQKPRILTLDERQDLPWAWTPDSKQVIFGSDRDGAFHLFRQAPEKTTPELMVGGKEESMVPRLTPDGKQIVYLQFRPGFEWAEVVRMLRVPLSGGPPELVLEGHGLTNLQCARLPSTLCLYSRVDEKRLVFFSFDPSRGNGHEVAHVDDDVPYAYNWSLAPDGSTLAIAKARKIDLSVTPDIRILSLTDHTERTIRLKDWPGVSSLDWAADGKRLWVSTSTNTGTYALLNVDLQGTARPVLEQTKMVVGWAIPSPDGRYLALYLASGDSNVWMIENF